MNHRSTQLPRGLATVGKTLRARLAAAPFALALGLVALSATGCVARVRGGAVVEYTEPYVEVSSVPVYVESYPSYYYNGGYAYLVDGQWYYQSRGHWVTFRSEPRPLATVRVTYEAKYGRHYRPRGDMASPPPRPHHHHDRH